jgi:hypothetical protein
MVAEPVRSDDEYRRLFWVSVAALTFVAACAVAGLLRSPRSRSPSRSASRSAPAAPRLSVAKATARRAEHQPPVPV